MAARATQRWPGLVDHGGDGHGKDRSDDPGEHGADGESEPHREGVQPHVTADDQWLEQVDL
jgi:hypothetical protein